MKSVHGILWLSWLSLLAALAGCGADAPGSCVTAAPPGGAEVCVDFGAGHTATSAMAACRGAMQTYSSGVCVTTGRIGRCTITSIVAGVAQSATVNYYAPTTVDVAMMSCTASVGSGTTTVFTPN